MPASLRHFLRFIDLDSTLDNHSFTRKRGAAFKLNDKPEGLTDFMLRWPQQLLSALRVTTLELEEGDLKLPDPTIPPPGCATVARWTNKADGMSSAIKFDYLIDASGRFSILNTKYLKNCKFNSGSLFDEEFYHASFKHIPQIEELVDVGEIVPPVKHASDCSYSASCYVAPSARIVGDAGCFIDPSRLAAILLSLAA
ncbi:hypothetical protein DV736_g6248, partial [Chaetothyriales sp. CBS 134916]